MATLAAPGMPAPDTAPVNYREQIEYYVIEGRNSDQLRHQMRQLGPRDPVTGQRYDGFARWNVAWNFSYIEKAGQCRLDGFEVDLDVVITLPQWNGREQAGRRLAENWDAFVANLATHEYGHRDIGRRAAEDIYRALSGLPGQPGCAGYDKRVNEAAQQALRLWKKADRQYDRETNHGATQGVRLP